MVDGALQAFMGRIGYVFQEPSLLKRALTHCSFGKNHNERLEFLGDALLSFVIAEELFRRFPHAQEGSLSRLRSYLVKGETLAGVARELQVGEMLRLGTGERKSGGAERDSILADTAEAIIGAIYLDAGFQQCAQVVLRWYAGRLEQVGLGDLHKDSKSALQEWLQAKHLPVPEYHVLDTIGQEHARRFVVECRVESLGKARQAESTSIRKAEQQAAEKVLQELE